MRIIVVGANHAGTTNLRALTRLLPNAEIVTYDKNSDISFLGCGIALWVKGEFKDPKGLFYADKELLESEGIQVNMRHDVTNIDTKNKQITIKNLETGKIFDDHYDKLVVAIGSWPVILPIEGITMENIKIVKWFKHAKEIKAANQDPKIKKVVVCGAGYIGVELVDAFAAAGKEVTLIDICDRVMPNYYDQEFTSLVESSMKKAGVKICTGQTVKKFEGVNNKVTTVITDKARHEADLVIWAVGFRPDTKILKDQIELARNGAIMVDKYMCTSDPDVYALGDCVQVYDNAKQQPFFIALATTAVRTGVIAALNIAGKKTASQGFQGSNAINVFGWSLSSTGVSEVSAKHFGIDYDSVFLEDNDRPEFMKNHKLVRIKIVWDKKTRAIIGAQVGSKANHTEIMYMFSLAIEKKLTIDELPFLDIFFLPHFNKPFNFITRAGFKAIGLDFFANEKYIVEN